MYITGDCIYIYKYIHTQKYWSLLRVRKICLQKIIISSLRFSVFFFVLLIVLWLVSSFLYFHSSGCLLCLSFLLVFTFVFHLSVA